MKSVAVFLTIVVCSRVFLTVIAVKPGESQTRVLFFLSEMFNFQTIVAAEHQIEFPLICEACAVGFATPISEHFPAIAIQEEESQPKFRWISSCISYTIP